jgi:CRP/FNR family cyclic AMP-dependent transcriptional regulator
MAATTRNFKAGEYLFREGDISDTMYVVKEGIISVRKKKSAAYIEIGTIHSKEVLGELSFFDRRPRSASAIAITDVEALEIDFESLDKIYTKVPDYIKTMMAAVAERLRRANDTIRRLQTEVVLEAEDAPSPIVKKDPTS